MIEEWESSMHDDRWAHLGPRRADRRWALSVVDETTRSTVSCYIDVRDLATLLRFSAGQVARIASQSEQT